MDPHCLASHAHCECIPSGKYDIHKRSINILCSTSSVARRFQKTDAPPCMPNRNSKADPDSKSPPSGRTEPAAWSNVASFKGVALNRAVGFIDVLGPYGSSGPGSGRILVCRPRTFVVHGVYDYKRQGQPRQSIDMDSASRLNLYIRRLELQGTLVHSRTLVITTTGNGQPSCGGILYRLRWLGHSSSPA